MPEVIEDPKTPATSRTRRILQNGLANLVGNTGTIVLQLASVPLLLLAWGPHLYGEWLIVSTVLSYIAFSDLGVTTVAHNRIDAAMGAGDLRRATLAFKSSLLLLGLVVALISSAFLLFMWLQRDFLLGLFSTMPAVEVTSTFLVLLLDGAVMIAFAYAANLFRSIRRNPETAYWLALTRLGGLAAIPASALFGATPFWASVVMLCIHVLSLSLVLLRLRRLITWPLPGIGVEAAELRLLLRLSGTFLLLPISNIVYLQVSVLLIAAATSPQYVALFVSLRTLTRLITQFVPMVGLAVWSEVAHSSGNQDRAAVGRMAKLVLAVSPATTIALIAGYLLLGPWFFGVWTHQSLGFDMPVFLWLLANASVLGLSTSFEVFPLSTNRHDVYAVTFLVVTLLALVCGWLLIPALGPVAFPATATLFGLAPIGYCLAWMRRSIFT